MAKKKLDKEAERTPSSPSKIVAVFKNETIHFVIGLMLVIFSVYLLLAFSSFFFYIFRSYPYRKYCMPIKVLLIVVVRQIWQLLIIK